MVLPLCGSGSGLNFMLLLYLRTIRPIASFSFYYVTTYIRTGPLHWIFLVEYWIFSSPYRFHSFIKLLTVPDIKFLNGLPGSISRIFDI